MKATADYIIKHHRSVSTITFIYHLNVINPPWLQRQTLLDYQNFYRQINSGL